MIRVHCLLYDGFMALDATGPVAALEMARNFVPDAYSITFAASSNRAVPSSGACSLMAHDRRDVGTCDTLLVPGGSGARNRSSYADLLDDIATAADEGRRVASVCTGALLLADAGVLKGRRGTTHWGEIEELQRREPTLTLEPDRLFVQDGNIWTSAGVTAGIDLTLALIQQDYGANVADRVASALVVPYRRPAAASQHGRLRKMAHDGRFDELLAWARVRLDEPLTIERLADKAGLSARQFSRAFRAELGVSPAKAIEQLRVERAKASIESGARNLGRVASDSGFANLDTMRRAFLRTVGRNPAKFLG